MAVVRLADEQGAAKFAEALLMDEQDRVSDGEFQLGRDGLQSRGRFDDDVAAADQLAVALQLGEPQCGSPPWGTSSDD